VVVFFIAVVIDDDIASVFDGWAEVLEALLVNWVSEDVVVWEALQRMFFIAIIFYIKKLFEGIISHDLHAVQFFSRVLLFFDGPFAIVGRDRLPEVTNIFL